jgi:glutathione S-transferase
MAAPPEDGRAHGSSARPTLRLHVIPFSTNVERVTLALAHKGLPVEHVPVDPDDRSVVVGVSGQPLVPVLTDGDDVVHDSTAILEHLERRFPDPPLYPRDAARREEVRIFVDWFDRVWKRPPNELADELGRPAPDGARIAELGATIHGHLARFEGLLDGRDYLFGEFGAADCAAFPFLKYATRHDPDDRERFHRVLMEHQALGDGLPRLRAWIDRVDALPRA